MNYISFPSTNDGSILIYNIVFVVKLSTSRQFNHICMASDRSEKHYEQLSNQAMWQLLRERECVCK